MEFRNYFLVLLAISILFVSGSLEKIFAQEDSVPDWIRQVAIWWGEGQISTQEYLDSISFLIEDEIIEVPGFVQLAEGEEITETGHVDFMETKIFEEKILEIIGKNLYAKRIFDYIRDPDEGYHGNTKVFCNPGDLALSGFFRTTGTQWEIDEDQIVVTGFGPQSYNPDELPTSFGGLSTIPSQGWGLEYYFEPGTNHGNRWVSMGVNCLNLPSSLELITIIEQDSELTELHPDLFVEQGKYDILGKEWDNTDYDNDGIINSEDNCWRYPNSDQMDSDRDGEGDICDKCPGQNGGDPDKDRMCTGPTYNPNFMYSGNDNCPDVRNWLQEDTDGDGIGDACDRADPLEPQRGSLDSDGDGIADFEDNCPNNSNENQADSDKDGIGDACDRADPLEPQRGSLDSDGDGIADNIDKCPSSPEDKNGYQDNDGCPDGRGS